MKTFNSVISGQEPICFHWKFFIINLHYKWSSKVDDICVSNIGKPGIRKTVRVLLPQVVKAGFPKKFNQVRKACRWRNTVVIILKMINMEKLNMLHGGLSVKIISAYGFDGQLATACTGLNDDFIKKS